MSQKRTSAESRDDEQTNEGSDAVLQPDDNTKRARLAPLYDTTLQDLPLELIECILIKAIAMEVEGLRLAKSVWKEKADLVISRLCSVCSQWSSILSTNFFRNELHRTLEGTAQKTIRLEILHESSPPSFVSKVTTLKDEIFMLCTPERQDSFINVYDRNNMAEVKDVIPLPGIHPIRIACSASNCVYVATREKHDTLSLLCITKDNEHKINVASIMTGMFLPCSVNVTASGSVIISSGHANEESTTIRIIDNTNTLQHEISLLTDVLDFYDVIQKSTGNMVLVSVGDRGKPKLTEIDMEGKIIRQYQSSLRSSSHVVNADKYGRILIADRLERMELLDSEFNLLDVAGPDDYQSRYFCGMHYNSERDEIVTADLTIFHFTEE